MDMDKKTFTELVAAYGCEPTRWPDDKRAAMLAYCEANQDARAILSHEEALDTLLAARLPAPPAHLETLILNEMHIALASAAKKHGVGGAGFWRVFFGALLRPLNVSMGMGLAAVCVAGVLSAPLIGDILNPPDLFAVINVVTGDILLLN